MKTAMVCLVMAALFVALTMGANVAAFTSPVSPVDQPEPVVTGGAVIVIIDATPVVFEDDNEGDTGGGRDEPRPTRGPVPPAYPDEYEPAPANPDIECVGDVDQGVTCK